MAATVWPSGERNLRRFCIVKPSDFPLQYGGGVCICPLRNPALETHKPRREHDVGAPRLPSGVNSAWRHSQILRTVRPARLGTLVTARLLSGHLPANTGSVCSDCCTPRKKSFTPMKKRKDPAAVRLGRRGGKKGGAKGGRVRAERLSPERRSQIARRAAQVRWAKKNRS
jgi:hypothetical protein